MTQSCYIHIPFCEKICSYCDFCKMNYYENFADKYLLALEKEIKTKYKQESLKTIYIGGGTPSCLSLKQLERLFKILKILKKEEQYEFTIELNFDTTTKEKLELLYNYGVNRLSFGLESIDNNNLKLLERNNSKNKIKEIIEIAKKIGFNNINVDLMYALPGENKNVLKNDLDFIFSLDIEHISTYSLIIENNTKLKINKTHNIEEDLDYEMYEMIMKEMKEKGYNHYEISNFAKEGYMSKHNLVYWNNEHYYGFGLGASSYLENKRIENTRSFTAYLKEKWIKNEEQIDQKTCIEYEILLNLRKKEGISLTNFKKKYQKELSNIYNYKKLIEEKLLIQKKDKLFIPEKKWYISNEIIVRLLGSEKDE